MTSKTVTRKLYTISYLNHRLFRVTWTTKHTGLARWVVGRAFRKGFYAVEVQTTWASK